MKMTNEERQALIGFINAEIARIQRKEELWDGDRMRIASHRLSLAALTAEPVKVPDEPTGGDAPCHLDEYEGYCWVAGARWMRGKILSRLNAIDNTAQQYEALAGWKMVPIEPTDEMLAAGDKFMDGLSELGNAYSAMLAAAPKPEGQ